MFASNMFESCHEAQKDSVFVDKTELMSEIQMIKDTITKYTDENPDDIKLSINKIEKIIDALTVYSSAEVGLTIFNDNSNELLLPKMKKIIVNVPIGMSPDIAINALSSAIRQALESTNGGRI